MNTVQKINIEPTYRKEGGKWALGMAHASVKLEGVGYDLEALVQIPPGEAGGNHRHPRVEVFACLSGELKLSWLDGDVIREEMMEQAGEKLTASVIPSGLAHAVKNVGQTTGLLLEYASDKQRDVETVEII